MSIESIRDYCRSLPLVTEDMGLGENYLLFRVCGKIFACYLQMIHVSGHKTQKTFMDYIKLSSDEIADEINAIVAASKGDIF